MGRYILRRILYALPIAFGVSVVCFSLVYIAPGDPLQTVMPPDATAETIALVKHAYGFDKPLPVQFLIWLGRVVTGDFGISIATRRPRKWKAARRDRPLQAVVCQRESLLRLSAMPRGVGGQARTGSPAFYVERSMADQELPNRARRLGTTSTYLVSAG